MTNRFRQSLKQAENRVEDRKTNEQQEIVEQAENKPIAAPIYDFVTNAAQKKRGKDINVYLTYEVYEMVSRISKQCNMKPSHVVDRALRHAFNIE